MVDEFEIFPASLSDGVDRFSSLPTGSKLNVRLESLLCHSETSCYFRPSAPKCNRIFVHAVWWLNKELCYIRLERNSSAASLRNSETRKYSQISTIRRLQNWPFVRAEQYVENKTLTLQGTESVGPSLGDPLLARYSSTPLFPRVWTCSVWISPSFLLFLPGKPRMN